MPVARRGGQRKRFCSATCRHRHWAATKPGDTPSEEPLTQERIGHTARVATLQALYERLCADVERYGTLIETSTGMKQNPSVGELRRVIADLNRFAPFEDQEDAEEADSLVAV